MMFMKLMASMITN